MLLSILLYHITKKARGQAKNPFFFISILFVENGAKKAILFYDYILKTLWIFQSVFDLQEYTDEAVCPLVDNPAECFCDFFSRLIGQMLKLARQSILCQIVE